MANDFYTPTGSPTSRSSLSSNVMRTEFTALQSAFDKLPTLTGKAYQVAHVNGASGALTSTDNLMVNASGQLGVGVAGNTFANSITVYQTGATAHYAQWANSTSGLASTDGLRVGIEASGAGAVRSEAAFELWAGGTQRLWVSAAGEVGIGSAAVAGIPLKVYSATVNGVQVVESAQALAYTKYVSAGNSVDVGFGGVANNAVIYAGGATRVFVDANGNVGLGLSTFGTSAAKVLALANATAPTSSPAGGGQLYSEAGALKWRGSSGTITTVAPA